MKIDYKKLEAAERKLNEWAETLPLEEGQPVKINYLGSAWTNGWDAGWAYQNVDVADFELIDWDCNWWSLDWYFDSDYEITDDEETQLTIQVSWEDDYGEHSEEWSVWDTELAEEI